MIKHKVKTSQEYRNEKECIAILKVLTTDLKVCRKSLHIATSKMLTSLPTFSNPSTNNGRIYNSICFSQSDIRALYI